MKIEKSSEVISISCLQSLNILNKNLLFVLSIYFYPQNMSDKPL